MNRTIHCLIAGSLLAAAALAQQIPAADNTKVNARDQQPGAATADTQKMDAHDQEIARQIRRAVVRDTSLSTYAHNAKIIVRDGTVTLKGPVRSRDESDSLFKKAVTLAGDGKVINQLDIAPPESK
jgi:osmotically-inducible protein OsmY